MKKTVLKKSLIIVIVSIPISAIIAAPISILWGFDLILTMIPIVICFNTAAIIYVLLNGGD